MEQFCKACGLLPQGLRKKTIGFDLGGETEELRLRVGHPLHFAGAWGELSVPGTLISSSDLDAVIDSATGYSRYMAAETIRQGYLTAAGGFRIGLCGFAVLEKGSIETIRTLSSVSIRIPREKKGIGTSVAEQWINNSMPNTLILGVPGDGKTTLLRDMVRIVSYSGVRVGLVDEKGEIAATYLGMPQLDVGPCTDVLEGCPKSLALPVLLRSMAPKLLAVDEISVMADAEALELSAGAGAALLATVHAGSKDELHGKKLVHDLLERNIFTHMIRICRSDNVRRYVMEEI